MPHTRRGKANQIHLPNGVGAEFVSYGANGRVQGIRVDDFKRAEPRTKIFAEETRAGSVTLRDSGARITARPSRLSGDPRSTTSRRNQPCPAEAEGTPFQEGKVSTPRTTGAFAKQPSYEGDFKYVGVDDNYFMVAALTPGPARHYQQVSVPAAREHGEAARDLVSFSAATRSGHVLHAPTMGGYVPGLAVSVVFDRISFIPEQLLVRRMTFRVIGLSRTVGEITYSVAWSVSRCSASAVRRSSGRTSSAACFA